MRSNFCYDVESIKRLSTDSYDVLRSLSMLRPDAIPESIVRGILKQIGDESESAEEKYRELVMRELVHGLSLVCRKETGEERVFILHRLVRRFGLSWQNRNKIKVIQADC